MVARHIAYIPNPAYELLTATGLRRFPQCVRERVAVMVPPSMLAWLPFLGHVKVRVLLWAFTVN